MSEFRKAIEKRFNQAQSTVCDVPTQRSGFFKATYRIRSSSDDVRIDENIWP